MTEIKVSLSLVVPGAGMLSSQVCEENPSSSYDRHRLVTGGRTKGGKKEVILYQTRKSRTVVQNIKISRESFHYMMGNPPIDSIGRPAVKDYTSLSTDQRLRLHFDQIAHDLNAVSYSYEILMD